MIAMRVTIAILLFLGLGCQVWTQHLAAYYAYQPALGAPLWTAQVGTQTQRLYAPWKGLVWQWRWRTRQPLVLGSGGVLLVVVALAFVRTRQSEQPAAMTGHGNAVWAGMRAIRQAGLFAKQGIVLAYVWQGLWRRTLRFNGEENVLIVGPPRSGKGIGPFICTLLDLEEGHTITVDIRGETYDATAGWQARRGARVIRFSLSQPGSARFSLPQAMRQRTPYAFRDAATIAELHIDPSGDMVLKEPHWGPVARALLTCALLYEVETNPIPTMAHIAQYWSMPDEKATDALEMIVHTTIQPAVAQLGQEVLNKTEREMSGVLSTMMRGLFLYRDPIMATNTATCDFRLEDFTQHHRWQALYFVMSDSEIAYLSPFIRAFLTLATQRWMENDGTGRHHITFLFDEFPSFGKMGTFVKDLAKMGGKGIQTLLGVQNMPQLKDLYGDPDLVVEACKVRMYFAANGTTTGGAIARQTGTGTATTIQESRKRWGWVWFIDDSRTQQHQQHARHLVTADEATQIPQRRAVIQVTEHPPVWGRKLRYWQRWKWKQRSRLMPPGGRING